MKLRLSQDQLYLKPVIARWLNNSNLIQGHKWDEDQLNAKGSCLENVFIMINNIAAKTEDENSFTKKNKPNFTYESLTNDVYSSVPSEELLGDLSLIDQTGTALPTPTYEEAFMSRCLNIIMFTLFIDFDADSLDPKAQILVPDDKNSKEQTQQHGFHPPKMGNGKFATMTKGWKERATLINLSAAEMFNNKTSIIALLHDITAQVPAAYLWKAMQANRGLKSYQQLFNIDQALLIQPNVRDLTKLNAGKTTIDYV